MSAEGGREQDVTIGYLSDPLSYGASVRAVERHETHGSIVFLAGDRAYKLKRAVKFPYMDYSTIELRRQMCLAELTVNRRMAPELYLDVRPIVREGGVLRFGSGRERGDAVDWVVVMRRFDQEALLEQLRRSSELTVPLLRLVAETVARFHAEAEVEHAFGGAAGIRAVIEDNVSILASKIGRPFGAGVVANYERLALDTLSHHAALLEERRGGDRVRRCHGDLHLNNIVVLDGRPLLFDAIEFNDRFSCIDVLYDLAFLLMDLDRHGLRLQANTVLNRYLDLSGEHAGLAAMPLFLSCRAAVRAHTMVAAAEARGDGAESARLRKDAAALLDKAVGYLAAPAPRLIAIGGVSGTGKSTLAYALAPLLGTAPGAVVIRSDVVRKQLIGVAETVRLPQSAYTPPVSARVYARMTEIASAVLASGYTAIADAVYGAEQEREDIAGVARRANVTFNGLWLKGPVELLARRIAAREGDASDATPDVLRAQLGFVTAPNMWTSIDASVSPLGEARRILGC